MSLTQNAILAKAHLALIATAKHVLLEGTEALIEEIQQQLLNGE